MNTFRSFIKHRRAGFSLLELLVVMGLIGLIVSILLPSLQRSVRQASQAVCMHNLKEIHSGLHMYRLDNNGWIPVFNDDVPIEERSSQTWFAMITPRYLGDPGLLSCPDDPFRRRIVQTARAMGIEASTSSYGLSDFIQTVGDGLLAHIDRHQPKRPNETLMIADVGPDDLYSDWGWAGLVPTHRATGQLPMDDSYDPALPQQLPPWLTQRHREGINALFLDGSVRWVSTKPLFGANVEVYYPSCAIGECTLCTQLASPHYSFSQSHAYWWTGTVSLP